MSNSIIDFKAIKAFNFSIHLWLAPRTIEIKWELSPLGWIKVNAYGATKGTFEHASIGENF